MNLSVSAWAAAYDQTQDALIWAGTHTEPIPGLLILRFDGPLYTANVRSVNRRVIAIVEQHSGTRVLALDATVLARVSLTVVHQFADLEQELRDRNVDLWVVALPPATLRMARQTPRWRELAEASRLFPTALAAVSAFRKSATGDPVA